MGHHGEIKQALRRQGWVCDKETKLWSHEGADDAKHLEFKDAAIYAIEKSPKK